MGDSARDVLQNEIEKTARKLEVLKNAVWALDDDVTAQHDSARQMPSIISHREFLFMEIEPAIVRLLTILDRPATWDEILSMLKLGKAELSKDPARHMRQIKTTVKMRSDPAKSWHRLRMNEEAGTVSLRIWDKGRVKSDSATPVKKRATT